MEDGIIELGTDRAKEFGFIPDLFEGYLWKRENTIFISYIESKFPNKGNFTRLMKEIWNKGFKIAVPTPVAKMRQILIENGFKQTFEWFPEAKDNCEIWIK